MASEVEEAHIRSAKLIPKFQQCGEEFVAGDVVFLNDGEAECAEGFGHRLGVIHGVAQRTNGGFVAAVANDEGDALVFRFGGGVSWRVCKPE